MNFTFTFTFTGINVLNLKGQKEGYKYSRTPLIPINWDYEPSGYAENPNNWENISTNGYFRLHISLCTNKTLMHNSFCVFDKRGKNLSHKKM